MKNSRYHVHIHWDCDESVSHVEFAGDLYELKAILKKWEDEADRIKAKIELELSRHEGDCDMATPHCKVYTAFRTEVCPSGGTP